MGRLRLHLSAALAVLLLACQPLPGAAAQSNDEDVPGPSPSQPQLEALTSPAYQAGSFSDFGMGVQQVHLAQGKDQSTMVVSWVTTYRSPTVVQYGLQANQLAITATSKDVVEYMSFGQWSGFIHHVPLTGLKPSTTYFYLIGDATNPDGNAGLRYFTTLPKVGQRVKDFQLAVAADIGQTNDTLVTIDHLIADQKSALLLLAGDTSYANCRPPLWDTFFNYLQPYAEQRPVMTLAGNHEIEWERDNTTGIIRAFQGYIHRFRMPQTRPTEISCPYLPNPVACYPSRFTSCYNYGNSYYSFDAATVHVIMLNTYTGINATTPQYNWLEEDLAAVDRKKTPWVVVMCHGPMYNSNMAHQNEFPILWMKAAIEPLLFQYQVNIVISGHVHAYERTFPVYQDAVNERNGITYIVVGDGANSEGHASTYIEPPPAWSAYRNGTQYGYGNLIIHNDRKMTWQWHRNVDGTKVLRDEVTICNTAKGLPASCKSPEKADKLNPARPVGRKRGGRRMLPHALKLKLKLK